MPENLSFFRICISEFLDDGDSQLYGICRSHWICVDSHALTWMCLFRPEQMRRCAVADGIIHVCACI